MCILYVMVSATKQASLSLLKVTKLLCTFSCLRIASNVLQHLAAVDASLQAWFGRLGLAALLVSYATQICHIHIDLVAGFEAFLKSYSGLEAKRAFKISTLVIAHASAYPGNAPQNVPYDMHLAA